MVSIRPYPFIIIPIILTVILSGGWFIRRVSGDAVYLFTPQGAQSKIDQETIQDTFPSGNGAYVPGRMVVPNRESSVIATCKDGGNILRIQHSQAVIRLNQFIIDHIELHLDSGNYTYRNLCLRSDHNCHNNPQVYIIPQMYQNPDQYANLSYPTATYDHRQRYYLGSSLGGVRLNADTGQILEAKAWLMTYQLRYKNERDNRLSSLWELEFEKRLLAYEDPFISLSMAHSQTLNRELARNAKDLYPRFALMFMLLILFAVLCTVRCVWDKKRRWPIIDWVLSRPNLALLGVVGAAMGVMSAIGALSYLGTPYPDIVTVMPFLIIAVRLDNTFLMIAALDNTKRTLPVHERIAEAMSESAVSITITVLTDVLSFACGVLTDFVAVQLFCVYTTVAVLITFAYQLSFLLGFLVLYAKWEQDGRHALAPWINTVPAEEYDQQSIFNRLFCMGSRPKTTPSIKVQTKCPVYKNGHSNGLSKIAPFDIDNGSLKTIPHPVHNCTEYEDEDGSVISRWFRNVYGPFLMSTYTQIGVVFLLILFWTTSLYGCFNLRQGLEPIKLLVDDSYAIAHFKNLELFWDYGSQMQVVFMNPGDLSDPKTRREILNITSDFASQTHSIGMEGVDFWMITMQDYLQRTEQRTLDDLNGDEFYAKLDTFLSLNENFAYRLDVIRENSSVRGDIGVIRNKVKAFRFMLGTKGFRTAVEQTETCDQFRLVAARYPEYNVRVFHLMFLFVDQYEQILPNVWQEIGSGMACMIGIALFLIPHPICSIWVTVSIASIDIGVIGYMTLWGLNMDTISMITIIMSIGFSVDFSAHIAYAYVVNIKEEPTERVCKALGTLGWPVLQGGIATLLGVVVLADLDSYMVVSFFKTVFLVILFGLLHALLFLPVMLNGLTPTSCPGWVSKLKRLFVWKNSVSGDGKSTVVEKPKGTVSGTSRSTVAKIPSGSVFGKFQFTVFRNLRPTAFRKSKDTVSGVPKSIVSALPDTSGHSSSESDSMKNGLSIVYGSIPNGASTEKLDLALRTTVSCSTSTSTSDSENSTPFLNEAKENGTITYYRISSPDFSIDDTEKRNCVTTITVGDEIS